MRDGANGAAPVGEVPEDANEHCPGTQSENAGKGSACEGCPNQKICAEGPKGPDPDLAAIAERLSPIAHVVLVMSGKGGVGKSTVAAQLAFGLAHRGHEVGLLDVDICGPSMPRMLGLEGEEIHQSSRGWSPVYVDDHLGVMSIGFMLPNPNDAVIWRGPRKNGLIKQFLKDVYWGDLDYLIIDTPPGTSDEHISIAQYLTATKVDGAVIVTTPQEVSLIDVRKEINFCKKVGINIIGVVENMSRLELPMTQLRFFATGAAEGVEEGAKGKSVRKEVTDKITEILKKEAPEIFESIVVSSPLFHASSGGGQVMASEMAVPFLGRIPMDPRLGRAAEEGKAYFSGDALKDGQEPTPSIAALNKIIDLIVEKITKKSAHA